MSKTKKQKTDLKDTPITEKFLEITQVKSLIGRPEKHRKIVKALGLRRIRHTVIRKDTPVIRGMINKIPHLVSIKKQDTKE